MISVYDLKPRFQKLLRPVLAGLVHMGVTANMVTIAAMLASVIYGGWIYLSTGSTLSLLCLPLFLFVRMALNAIDGMLAQEYHQKSKLGFYLNELGDIVSDLALYLPFVVLMPEAAALLLVGVMFLMVIVEVAGILAIGIGGERRYDGPFGKSDRAVAFGALAVVMALWGIQPYMLAIMCGFTVLSILTIMRRIQKGLAPKGLVQ